MLKSIYERERENNCINIIKWEYFIVYHFHFKYNKYDDDDGINVNFNFI